MVACGNQRSFVMADIPGLIEGAADGAGLGIRFLKHLQRTRVLLHLVDIAPVDPAADPVRDARSIVGELGKFSEDLLAKPRWLVLNKSDLLPPEEATAKAISIAQALDYRGPAFLISGVDACGHDGSHRGGDAIPRDGGSAGAGQSASVPELKRRREAAKRKPKPKRARPSAQGPRVRKPARSKAKASEAQADAQDRAANKKPAVRRVFRAPGSPEDLIRYLRAAP